MSKIIFTKNALKEIKKFSSGDQQRIIKKIAQLNDPNFHPDVKKIANCEHLYRLRVGNIRIIFEIDIGKSETWIRKIGFRGNIY